MSTSSPSTARSGRARRLSSSPAPPSGEIGILPRHIPVVAQLVDDAMVRVEREGEDDLRIAVNGGFMSVTEEGVIVLAESAEFAVRDRRRRGAGELRIGRSRDCRQGAGGAARPRQARLAQIGVSRERAHDLHGRARRLCWHCWSWRSATGCGICARAAPRRSCVTSPQSAATAGATAWSATTAAKPSFYRLSSLRWWPDRRLSRRGLEIMSRRAPRGDEFDIMTEEIVVLELRDTTLERPDRRSGYEMALDRGALTAFLSWLESRPSPRARRRSA